MNVNLLTMVQWSVFFLLLAAIPPNRTMPDTLKIVSQGINNSVVIDSVRISTSATDSVCTNVNGNIIQEGKQNLVQINTGKNPLSQKSKSTVIIKQTGKNNSVKINSQ
jgi:hypothetical protein